MKFKLNIPMLTSNISDYYNNYSNTKQIIGDIFESLYNVDSGWNDEDSKTFVSLAKKNRNKIEEYFKSFDGLYKELESFKDNIDKILIEYNYSSVILTYNNLKFPTCFSYIEEATTYLNEALSNLASAYSYYLTKKYNSILKIHYPDYDKIAAINRAVFKIGDVKGMIEALNEALKKVILKIERAVSDSELTMAKLSGFEHNIIKRDFQWSSISSNVSIVKPDPLPQMSAQVANVVINNNNSVLDSVSNLATSNVKMDFNTNSDSLKSINNVESVEQQDSKINVFTDEFPSFDKASTEKKSVKEAPLEIADLSDIHLSSGDELSSNNNALDGIVSDIKNIF